MKKIIGVLLLISLILCTGAFAFADNHNETKDNTNISIKTDYIKTYEKDDENKTVMVEETNETIEYDEVDIYVYIKLNNSTIQKESINFTGVKYINFTDREYVIQGWHGIEYDHYLSSNNDYIIVAGGSNSDYEVRIVSSNKEEWRIIASGNIPPEGINFLLYFQYKYGGRTSVYRMTVTVTGEGSVPIVEGVTGTGQSSINGVRIVNIIDDNGDKNPYIPGDSDNNYTDNNGNDYGNGAAGGDSDDTYPPDQGSDDDLGPDYSNGAAGGDSDDDFSPDQGSDEDDLNLIIDNINADRENNQMPKIATMKETGIPINLILLLLLSSLGLIFRKK